MLIQDIAELDLEIESNTIEFEEMIYIPEELTKHLVVEIKREPDYQLKLLLDGLQERDIIQSPLTYDIMVKVDRRCFVPSDATHLSYSDIPRSIGWNTTISAPHMHALTLEKLKDALIPGGKGLDIGTGSGYLAACFAEIMKKDCRVYMIDHIQEIMDFAIKNICKQNKHLLKCKRIIPLTMDGRKGLQQHGPYNVIHVGGAM